jgi:Glycosyl hydrolase catalytic core/Secretion system C-terminal sorting domain
LNKNTEGSLSPIFNTFNHRIMKKIFIIAAAFLVSQLANAQLTIYSNLNQQGTSATCVARTVHVNTSIPGGLNNAIKSITLNQGFQAVLAENADGSGESFCYVAHVSTLNVNLAVQLQNKISFIRVLPLPTTPVKKKGAGEGNNITRDSLKVTWWYDWGRDDVSTTTQSYVPMMWGAYSTFETSMNTIVSKTNVTHLLAFNEPDSDSQGGGSLITTDPLVAVPYYKRLLRSGMRMGSPATTEGQYNNWLSDFRTEATAQNLRVDYVAVHWYDWGNICGSFTNCDTTKPKVPGTRVDMNANNIFNRFKNHINNVYALHKKPIWITEFHAHDVRPDAVQEAFMRLALPWLDANPNVERYAYFFGNDVFARNPDGTLTGPGKVYSDHVSVDAYTENIYDTRPAVAEVVLASWEASGQTGGGTETFAPTLDVNMTAPSPLTRGSGVGAAPGSSAGYWGGNTLSTTTAAAGVTANKFLTFSLKANTGKAVSYSSIEKFNIRISNTGPIKYQIDYQINNGAFSPCATVTGPTRTTANFALGPIDLSTITALQNVPSSQTVTFRITPFDASGTGSFLIGSGTADTEADLSIMGSFTDNIVTPVTLSDFQSKKVKDKVLLTWATQSEVNFSHFVLERSTDGKSFYNLSKINASKLSSGSTYNYTDTPDATATNYYRLKMVDVDGSFVYSKIISENYDALDAPFLVYPSITTGNKIETTFKKVSDAAQIKVFNMMGQLMGSYNLEAGTSAKTIEIAHFTEGSYFLMLQDKGAVQTRKFIKQ